MTLPWVLLVVAGFFEIAWAVGLKFTHGFTRPIPSLLTVAAMAISFLLLSRALMAIPVGTAYAVWTGIGAAGTALVGMWLFGEPAAVLRILSILLIIAGIIGLKLAG